MNLHKEEKWNGNSNSLIYYIIYNADDTLHTSPYETRACCSWQPASL